MSADPTVGVVGDGPAIESIRAALDDLDVTTTTIEPSAAETVDLPILVDRVASAAFETLDAAATGRWVAVELGGIGGVALADVEATISALDPAGGCFECLRLRVRANLDDVPADPERPDRRTERLAGAHAGHLAASLIAGEGPSEPTVTELPYAERRLLPVPTCQCTPAPDRSLDRRAGDRSIEAATSRAEDGLDGRIGIVRSIGEPESFPAPYYLATLCETEGFSDVAVRPQAAGVDVDWSVAFMKAMGEALERYSAGVYRDSRFEVAPLEERPGAVAPEAFVRPSEGYADPDPTDPIAWVPGEALDSGEAVWLPAEFVHFPPLAQRHKPSITTGLGLGNSTVEALLSGLYEVVERDATMLAWYSTFDPLAVEIEADSSVDTLRRRVRAEDLSVETVLVTQDVDVPVIVAAVHRDDPWPRFAVGSAADLDPTAAADAAVAEAVQNWMELRAMGRERAEDDSPRVARYADRPAEARSFVEPDAAIPAASIAPDDRPGGMAELEAVLARVRDAGLEAYAARLTPTDVETLGFEAVRVLVPGAQPLFTDTPYFGERAERVPADLGFRPALDRTPHPYP